MSTTRDFDTQDMDELFPCLKSIEDGVEEKRYQTSECYPRGVCSNSLYISYFYFRMICNGDIA